MSDSTRNRCIVLTYIIFVVVLYVSFKANVRGATSRPTNITVYVEPSTIPGLFPKDNNVYDDVEKESDN